MKPIYTVPVIPNNLRHRETFIQIADALNYLNLVFDDVLTKGRITSVHKKVQNITKTKKATQIFSNSKYPVSTNIETYKSIFVTSKCIEPSKTQIKLKEPQITEQSNNTLQFYHVKVKKDPSINKQTMTGLGRFPSNAQIVNELLLFNTHKNPYENYEMLDPLSNTIESIRLTDENNMNGPDAAPLSMTQRNGTVREAKDSYFYSPDLGEVPSIDVPLDLPDLPGIANDLRYLMEHGPGIAPSVTTTPILPDLPQITPAEPVSELLISNNTVIETISANIQPDISHDLPDHLPDLPIANKPPADFTAAIEALPAIEPEKTKPDVIVTSTPTKIGLPSSDIASDARASLMEAIRQAGKKTLHSVKTEPEKPKTQVNVGNDLMADLHNKLAMRRKGISGNKVTESGLEVSSAMTRVSAMIPPPVQSNINEQLESTATEDEDNDWDE